MGRHKQSKRPYWLNETETEPPEGKRVVLVDGAKLHPLESRPPLGLYIRQLFQRRHFIAADARSRAFAPNRDLWLGRLWLIVQPLLDGLMYGLMFGLVLKTKGGIENFVGYLMIGLTFFNLMSGLFAQGAGFMATSRSLIRAFRFPRAALVISAALRGAYNAIPPVIAALVVALAMQWDKPLSWMIVFVIPIFILIVLFGTGLFFFAAWLTAWIPDAKVGIQLLTRAWFFTSGVFFSIERFVDHPAVREFMLANPAYIYLTAVRDSVMYHNPITLSTWGTMCAWAFGTFAVGFLLFWSSEARYTNVR